jgi:hypothetical protein
MSFETENAGDTVAEAVVRRGYRCLIVSRGGLGVNGYNPVSARFRQFCPIRFEFKTEKLDTSPSEAQASPFRFPRDMRAAPGAKLSRDTSVQFRLSDRLPSQSLPRIVHEEARRRREDGNS